MGAPKYVPTDEVKARCLELAAKGHGTRIIAIALGIDRDTVMDRLKDELNAGRIKFAERCATVHLDALDDPDPKVRQVAAIWLEKSRLHYSEKVQQEISGPNGGPVQVQPVINVNLSGNKPQLT